MPEGELPFLIVRFWDSLTATGLSEMVIPLQAFTGEDIGIAIQEIWHPDRSDLEIATALNFDTGEFREDDKKTAEILYDLALFLKLNPQIVSSLPENQRSQITASLKNFRSGSRRVIEALDIIIKYFIPDITLYSGSPSETTLIKSIHLFDLAPGRNYHKSYEFPEWGDTFEKRNQRKYDLHFMRLALDLAKTAYVNGHKSPVACIVVDSDHKIISEAVNKFDNGKEIHAEIAATEKAIEKKGSLYGCTVYVSYEPCDGCGSKLIASRPEIAGYVWPVNQKAGAQSRSQMFTDGKYQQWVLEPGKYPSNQIRIETGIRGEEAYKFYVHEVGWKETTLKPEKCML